jgi:NAD(P)-dependent dehydrogenase (short-subunit alcohol dehydrogenase family)
MSADLFSLSGKAALVTGGTSGIGLMMARGLLDAGARIIVSSRKAQACAEAVEELGAFGDCRSIVNDLSTEHGCLALAEEVGAMEPALDILVNNAGATWAESLETFPASAWDKVTNLNLKAPFLLTRALLGQLTAAGTQDDPARVINVGSVTGEPGGLHVLPYENYSYAASKAGLHHLTRFLARELGPRHITVNVVAPGPFPSRMMASTVASLGEELVAKTPTGRLGNPDDMAGVVVFLSSRAGAHVTGAVIPVDGGISTTV